MNITERVIIRLMGLWKDSEENSDLENLILELFKKRFESIKLAAGKVCDYSPNQPRDKNGKWTDGGLTNTGENGNIKYSIKISATGANKFENGFTEKNLEAHWNGSKKAHFHKNEYPEWTKEQYALRALDLIQKPVGGDIYGYKNAKGQIIRFDAAANDFVVGTPNKGIVTMFKPKEGKAYFDRLNEREGLSDE